MTEKLAAAFSVTQIRRAVKAAQSTGLAVSGLHFPPGGGFTVLTAELEAKPTRNEWDEVLEVIPL